MRVKQVEQVFGFKVANRKPTICRFDRVAETVRCTVYKTEFEGFFKSSTSCHVVETLGQIETFPRPNEEYDIL